MSKKSKQTAAMADVTLAGPETPLADPNEMPPDSAPGQAPVEEPPSTDPGEPAPPAEPPPAEPPIEEPGEPAPMKAEGQEPSEYESEEPAEVTSEMTADDLMGDTPQPAAADEGADLKAILEAIVYITDEPLAPQQIAQALNRPLDQVQRALSELTEEYSRAGRGLTIREVAGGYKMGTKPEYHEELRAFVKNLKPPLKLSLAALETLAVIAYKQPITGPEIQEIRGVQGTSALKTLLDRKLIAVSGRKNVIGKPMLYKTTKEFLIQFGLKDLSELPTLKEFEELGRMAFGEGDAEAEQAESQQGEADQAALDAVVPEPAEAEAPAAAAATAGAEQSPPVTEPESASNREASETDTASQPAGDPAEKNA